MTTPTGWYHAQGDPPDTVRLWDGTQWVGFPQRNPDAPIQPAAVTVGGPAHGQKSLMPFGILAMIPLFLASCARLYSAYIAARIHALMPDYNHLSIRAQSNPPAEVAEIERLGALSDLLNGLSTLAAAVTFVLWFYIAYRNVSRWTKTRHSPMWTVLGWIVPFLNMVRPGSIMQELCDQSPRADRRGEINPVVAWAWWICFIGTQVADYLLGFWSARATELEDRQMVVLVLALVQVLSAVGGFLGVRLIHQISYHQDLRFQRITVQASHTPLAAV